MRPMPRSIRRSSRSSNYYLRQVLKYNTPLLYRGEIYDLIYADGETLGFQARRELADAQRRARSGAGDDV